MKEWSLSYEYHPGSLRRQITESKFFLRKCSVQPVLLVIKIDVVHSSHDCVCMQLLYSNEILVEVFNGRMHGQ